MANDGINKSWEESHFYTQKKGDIAKPTMCSHCGGSLKVIEKGWLCEECLCLIDGISFYQGRNSKEKEIIKNIEKISNEIDENERLKWDTATLSELKNMIERRDNNGNIKR
jgi:hypothetical protein